jgi:hypothetical protein
MFYAIVPLYQEIVVEALPSQNCHMNMGLILNGFGATGAVNVKMFSG